MSVRASPRAIGAFVLGAAGLIVAAVLVHGSGLFFSDTERYCLFFDGSVNGLTIGSPVKFRGVAVGTVKDIQVDADPVDLSVRVPVFIDVNRDRISRYGRLDPAQFAEKPVDVMVRRGLRAKLKLESFVTGQLYVEFDFYPDTMIRLHGRVKGVQELPTVPSGLDEFMKTVEAIPFSEVARKVMTSLDALEKLVTSKELGGSIRVLEESLVGIRDLARTAEVKAAAFTQDAHETLGEAKTLIQHVDGQVGPLTEDLRGGAAAFRESLRRVDEVLATVRSTVEEDSRLHAEVLRTLRDLSGAARAIRILGETLEAHPDVLLRGKGTSGGEK